MRRRHRSDLSFLQIATPFVPNGGIFARFPGIAIPDVVSPMGPGQATQYDTTYVVNEYDLWGDFPAYFNPVAILNAVLGHEYAHVDNWYDAVDPTAAANHVKVVTNPAGGTDTYILVPASRLPLLGPLRDMAYHLGVSAAAERLLGAIEPLLRVIVDMGYTDRLNLNPEVRKPFSLFTPPHKIVEALNAVPGAVREGVENLLGITRTPAAPAVAPPAAAAAVQPASRPESAVPSETAPEAETNFGDDELETPPSTRKDPRRTRRHPARRTAECVRRQPDRPQDRTVTGPLGEVRSGHPRRRRRGGLTPLTATQPRQQHPAVHLERQRQRVTPCHVVTHSFSTVAHVTRQRG
ncbi:MAG: PE-PPE domain-containing protein [Mycobacterium sp.]|nr:PE-PPE domain-containing protein [Mycobacterium sp.]